MPWTVSSRFWKRPETLVPRCSLLWQPWPLRPATGWTAIRPTLERIAQYGLQYRYPNLQPWYMYLTPRETVGTIWLYYVPPEK